MKTLCFAFLACCLATGTFAQSFRNGIGIAYFSTSGQGLKSTNSFGLTYSPRVNVYEDEHSSVSIGLPISIGLSLHISTNSDGSDNNSASAMVDLPLLVNYNYGAGSTRECEDRFGFFVGAGFGYHHADGVQDTTDAYGNQGSYSYSLNAYGPVGNAGIRLGWGERGHNVEFRVAYMKGLDASKADIFGAGVLFNF
jgi:hypothetical protein